MSAGPPISRRASSRGLTLIEVMVAVGVLAMVAMTIWAATSQTARTRDIVEQSHDRLHQVRIAFDMLSRDLNSAFLSMHRSPIEPSHDTVFIGQDSGDEDRVDFVAFTHQRRYLDVDESDQCEVAYFVAEDPDDGKQLNLVRREAPLLDIEPLEGGQYLILVENIRAFDLQYFDFLMNEWQDEWDTSEMTDEAGFLPHQVRIRLVVYDRHGEERVYGSQVAVPMRTPIWRKQFMPGPAQMVTR
jgi:general secretion pathway protein J